MTWAALPTGATNLQFERRVGDGGTFQMVATVPATASNFTDAATEVGAQYCYRARVTAGGRTSNFSNTVCAPAPVPATGAWITRSAMPTARQEMPAASIGSEVFVPGGLKEDGLPLATLEIYNAATGTWRAGANMPEARHHHGVVAVNGRIYSIGGFIGAYPNWHGTRDLFEYNPATNQWIRRANMPEERGGHAAAVLNGEIYVVGGVGVDHALRTALLIYNPTTDQWRTGPSMSVPREHLTAAAAGNRIYAIGGRVTLDQARFGETTTNLNTVEAFDVLDQQWRTVAGMLTARGGLFAATNNNRIYVMGGEFPGIFAEVEEYNPQNNSWRTMTPMRQPRHAAGTASVGDTIFTMGGGPRFGFAESNTNHGFVVPRP